MTQLSKGIFQILAKKPSKSNIHAKAISCYFEMAKLSRMQC